MRNPHVCWEELGVKDFGSIDSCKFPRFAGRVEDLAARGLMDGEVVYGLVETGAV